MASYLRDEFLSELPAELLSFVARTSVLEELSGPFCDAVLQERGSAVTLAQLEGMSQLLMPLDAGPYSLSLARSASGQPQCPSCDAPIPSSNRNSIGLRAPGVSDRGELDAAIAHAVAAGDPHRVGDLLWPRILEYVTTGRNELVQTWISSFSHAQIAEYAPLALCAAHSALALGRVGEAQRWRLEAACALEHHERIAASRDRCRPALRWSRRSAFGSAPFGWRARRRALMSSSRKAARGVRSAAS